MKKLIQKIKTRIDSLTIRQRLTYSNLLMFLVPVAVTLILAVGALGIAYFAFVHFTLPRMGLTLRELHDMGEVYEGELKSFTLLLALLLFGMLILLVLSIVLTNRFLVRFMFRRVEEPLALLGEGAANIGEGRLETVIPYDRQDEFTPVCEAFNRMSAGLLASAKQSAAEEQMRRELFAGISHDLKTPLTTVRAYTEALLDGVAKTPEEEKRYLSKILAKEGEIERMTDALFLYTKLGLPDYPVDLCDLCPAEEVTRLFDLREDEHLTLTVRGSEGCVILADPFLFGRIYRNLFDNSAKYRRGDVAHLTLTAEEREDGILLSLSDDGIGVAKEALPRLFEPFYRTDPARKNPAGGSGLGLSIVREAVAHMGGKVWAEGVLTGGLCICILFQKGGTHGENSDR